jgi:3',5'-cyclic AMP phosphodiesterase CpdA
MTKHRRDFFRLAGGAIWIAAGAAACAGRGGTGPAPRAPANSAPPTPEPAERGGFLLMQITDTHWGYAGPANPDPRGTLERAIAEIAGWPQRPDLVVHTGDVTHLTADAAQRRARLVEARELFGKLGTKLVAIPGEHDASLDRGAVFQEVFGPTHWAFEHRGVYFIGLDNASDPKGGLGEAQLAWLDAEVARVPRSAQLVVFAHRPLFPLAQAWDWFTGDGEKAIAILEQHPGTTVFYGHIHQANLARTGATTHVSGRSLVFPLPAPMSVPEKKPLPWDAAAADHGLGYRGLVLEGGAPLWVDRALVG